MPSFLDDHECTILRYIVKLVYYGMSHNISVEYQHFENKFWDTLVMYLKHNLLITHFTDYILLCVLSLILFYSFERRHVT